jgi:hypothetical protein
MITRDWRFKPSSTNGDDGLLSMLCICKASGILDGQFSNESESVQPRQWLRDLARFLL